MECEAIFSRAIYSVKPDISPGGETSSICALHFLFYGTLPAIIIKPNLNNIGFYDASHRNNRLRRPAHSMPVRPAIGFIARRNKPSPPSRADACRLCRSGFTAEPRSGKEIMDRSQSCEMRRPWPICGAPLARPFDPDFVTLRHARFHSVIIHSGTNRRSSQNSGDIFQLIMIRIITNR
jgi:hypothetical protein